MSYDVLHDAIVNKRQVTCLYHGHYREICPHVLGTGKDGAEMVLSFQFAGGSTTRLPPGGEWRCMRVDEIKNAKSRTGDWHTGDSHLRPQTCVKDIDVEVGF
ncbi:MAG: hypothetical protein F9K29_24005 [Hyphomicrobiaceae bacterium]|nr:MAG: hypothetical protein F9K29_24005 [Hyphomicrobiaceae bacterium]